ILYNYNIKKNLARAREAERNAFKRQLVAEIKTAYFGYLKAVQIEHLLNETAILLRENLRVSKSLYRNHKATEEVVFRAQAELSELKQQKAEAGKGRELTAAYFNFLLNRPLDESIIEVADSTLGSLKDIDLAEAENRALAHREEFEQLQRSINAASNNVSVAKTEYLPGISFVFDYGIQGESYRFSKEADFWMASVVLQWNLFNGFQDKAKVQQARLEEQKLKTKQRELQKQILLKVREAHHNLKVARRTVIATNERLNSAKKSFQIVNKKYSQGMAPQIEYLDARTSFTNAGVNQIIARYDLQIRLAEFERVIADYPLQKNGKDN
ncbi:MAG: TolC family protein, partial [Calditrichae bacterium]|nr:TolC family protein [Calditrichia bacterium]NIW79540.1 TolC family protein [Calditrichia bacterium]